MGIAAEAPEGGISAQLGAESYSLLLRNGEIERFEKHHKVSIFVVLDECMGNTAPIHQMRDLVSLGLVGAGMDDAKSDRVVSELPPAANIAIRGVARDLLLAAFIEPEAKKKDSSDGSLSKSQ